MKRKNFNLNEIFTYNNLYESYKSVCKSCRSKYKKTFFSFFLYSNLTGESPIPYSEVKQVLPIDGVSGVLFMYGNGMQQIYDYPNKKLITQTGTAPEGTKYFSVGNDIYGYKVNGTEINFYKVKISNYNAIGPYNGTDVYGIAKTDANLKEQVEAYIPR